mgnify:CR=1 FL=1
MDAEPEKDSPDATPIENVEGHIELRNVVYAYNTEKDVLGGVYGNNPESAMFNPDFAYSSCKCTKSS